MRPILAVSAVRVWGQCINAPPGHRDPGDACEIRLDRAERPGRPDADLPLDGLGLSLADLEEKRGPGDEMTGESVEEMTDCPEAVLPRVQGGGRVVVAHGPRETLPALDGEVGRV